MNELINKRSYTAKHFDNGDGTFTMDAHAGHIHYKDITGFRTSDIKFIDKGTYFEMVKHNYTLRVNKDFGASTLIEYQNHYEGANHTIIYEPHSLVWLRQSDKDIQAFRTQQNVQGILNAKGNKIYFTNAFGPGIDFEVTLNRSGFTKEVVIPNKPAIMPTPPTVEYRLVALFKYTGDNLDINLKNGTKWDKVTMLDAKDGFDITETSNPIAKSFIRPAYAYDSEDNRINLRVYWALYNGALWQIKHIPLEQFEQATYPVRFDTTTDYYAGAGDGVLALNCGSAWSVCRASATCTAAQDSNTSDWLFLARDTVYIYRSVLPIDTSGIGSGNTVTAATLNIKPSGNLNDDCNMDAYICPITLASHTSLAVGDFDGITFTDYGNTAWSAAVVDTYFQIAMNATGYGAIDVAGWTDLAVTSNYDYSNTAPCNTTSSGGGKIYYSEQAGTGDDPYLSVTYTTGAAAFIPKIVMS